MLKFREKIVRPLLISELMPQNPFSFFSSDYRPIAEITNVVLILSREQHQQFVERMMKFFPALFCRV